MRLTGEAKFFAGVIITTLLILVGAIFLLSKPAQEEVVSLSDLVPSDAWATGAATPKATLVEFSDFECPACAAAFPVVKDIVNQYKDSLRFAYRHFPLEQHPNSRLAAYAAEAAGAQGKFWQMHDALFQNQTELSKDKIEGLARDLGLNVEQFTKDITEETYKQKVENDITSAIKLGVSSTPTFFLNGKKVTVGNLVQLKAEIEKVLTQPSP